ncbi:MAG TPA: NADH-quinone oxidoreductase subunit NuoG [Aggregatilineales bacterium]|nr:NADH-quinone oxidoreductase subunit NuoG [Aggregatilineales bacterium]
MTNTVKIIIDDVEFHVPEGMNLVDAVKMCGNDIPVFCYHPKLGHDGNCRMCLVELALPRQNRETGEMELAWFPTLQTACTQKTQEGMAIRTTSQKVVDGRRAILEFLLSSHPLDCPICDKGGECPLQNLTMRHGPGVSRMYWEEKMRLGKHIPLGELIYLDQERCIHCARCIRFQDMIADDPVLDFSERGRRQQIITNSTPPFDSIFSGNTTDICPVGALTTADFRFRARPWEMRPVATICTHCPVGCNMHYDTRVDREAGGRTTIRRMMPRQNEQVNEIWMCDKGRFVHHYMEHSQRLTQPLVRKGGKLVEATWDEAIDEIISQFRAAGADIAGIAGGRLSNEDYYAFQKLIRMQGSNDLIAYPNWVQGAEFTAQVGIGVGTNLSDLGKGDAVIVVASDLHEEAPIWWLRLIAAAKRGATVITVNGRDTRLDKFATYRIRYHYGEEVATLNGMLSAAIQGGFAQAADGGIDGLADVLENARQYQPAEDVAAAAAAFASANNAIIMVGGEGLTPAASRELTRAAANLLTATGHYGRENNGLMIVWPAANLQGANDMGISPTWAPGYQPVAAPGRDYDGILAALQSNELKAIYLVGADPVYDDPAAENALRQTKAYVVVQDMFLTPTAELADVVLPAQSMAERSGTYTSGERRVQRLYPAIDPIGESMPDWQIIQTIGEALAHGQRAVSEVSLMLEITQTVPQYEGLTYTRLARVEEQFPDVGGDDLYYGGTAYQNMHGLGAQWPASGEVEGATWSVQPAVAGDSLAAGGDSMVIVPIRLVYDREPITYLTELLHQRIPVAHVGLNPDDAARLGVTNGDMLAVEVDGREIPAATYIDPRIAPGVATMPLRLQQHGAPLAATVAPVKKLEKIEA